MNGIFSSKGLSMSPLSLPKKSPLHCVLIFFRPQAQSWGRKCERYGTNFIPFHTQCNRPMRVEPAISELG